MASQQPHEREELDPKARQGETVVPGGTGGKSLEAQEYLAEGRSRGGQTRKEQLGREGYQELGSKGGHTRKEQIELKGTRKWAVRVDSAPQTSQGVNVLLRKESTLTTPGTELGAVAHNL